MGAVAFINWNAKAAFDPRLYAAVDSDDIKTYSEVFVPSLSHPRITAGH